MKSGNYFSKLRCFFESRLVRKAGRAKERGSVLPIVTLGAIAFLGAGALAIDISHQMTAGVELQNAADASARAGASALDGTIGGIGAAVDRALAMTNSYDWGTSIAFTRADVSFAANYTEFNGSGTGQSETTAKTHAGGIRFIKVKIPLHTVRGIFTKVTVGKTMLGVTRSSIAMRTPNGVLPASADAPEGTPPVLSNDSVINTVCNWVPLSALQDPAAQ